MIKEMHYRQYKQHYSDCETIKGSYNAATKTIQVIIPEGREKPSGVRGQKFHCYHLVAIINGEEKYLSYRATTKSNALKQHKKECKAGGYGFTEKEYI
jgi:hypothetical protein